MSDGDGDGPRPDVRESERKALSPARETWDPGLGEPQPEGVGPEPDPGEPRREGRFLSSDMTSVGYEMVERGPLARSAVAVRRDARRQPAPMIEDPDRELVSRWQAGEESAFEQLVRRHEKKVYRLLLRMMGSHEEAQDVAQETFLSLHRHGHRFRGDARFSTFVYRVASNAALNRRRTLGRNRARMQKLQVRQAAGDDLPEGPRNPEDAAGGVELSQAVREALETLRPSLRLPVLLYDIEGLAYGEIAEVLGVAEGTVKSRIHRARQALRLKLAPLVKESHEGPEAGPESSAEGAAQ